VSKFYTAMLLFLITVFAAPAIAGDLPNIYNTQSGGACKIAGVNGGDDNNQFNARAIYASNDSTTKGVFVICLPTFNPTPMEGGVITNMYLAAFTKDGQARQMTCTAMIGSLQRPQEATYSSKTITVDGSYTSLFTWDPDDFNGASSTGGIVGSAWGSITCNVPPQTAISLFYAKQNTTIR
jgi:hypothetical protein